MSSLKEENKSTSSTNRAYPTINIKELANKERPREKLLSQGASTLKPAELLAIILGVGTRKEGVLTMSFRLLKEYGADGIAQQKDPRFIQGQLNVPLSKACQVVACFELGRRLYQMRPGGYITITNPNQVFSYLKEMRKLKKEQLRALYLNNHNQLIHDEVVSLGTTSATLFEIKEIFRPALEYSAAAIIIAHNHPSNIIKPTKNDLEATKRLIKAGQIFNIKILDHLIIGHNQFISIMP